MIARWLIAETPGIKRFSGSQDTERRNPPLGSNSPSFSSRSASITSLMSSSPSSETSSIALSLSSSASSSATAISSSASTSSGSIATTVAATTATATGAFAGVRERRGLAVGRRIEHRLAGRADDRRAVHVVEPCAATQADPLGSPFGLGHATYSEAEIGRDRESATSRVGSRDIAIAMIDATCQKQIRPTGDAALRALSARRGCGGLSSSGRAAPER